MSYGLAFDHRPAAIVRKHDATSFRDLSACVPRTHCPRQTYQQTRDGCEIITKVGGGEQTLREQYSEPPGLLTPSPERRFCRSGPWRSRRPPCTPPRSTPKQLRGRRRRARPYPASPPHPRRKWACFGGTDDDKADIISVVQMMRTRHASRCADSLPHVPHVTRSPGLFRRRQDNVRSFGDLRTQFSK